MSSTIIQQGAVFDWLQIYFKGDLTTYTPKGQIRSNYAYLGGELLAEFSFLPLAFGEYTLGDFSGEYTLVRPYLNTEQTLNLPNHKPRKDTSCPLKPGRNCWLYDIKMVDIDGEVKKKTKVRFLEVEPDGTRF